MEEFEHGIESLGLIGVKMGLTCAGFDPRDERCSPEYDSCQERGLPIWFHTGTTFIRAVPRRVTRPSLIDEVAIAYPDLRMVLAHVGHPFCEECLVVIKKQPHVCGDISALYYWPWQFYAMLIAAEEYQATHKLLFDTDHPFAGGPDSIAGIQRVNDVIGQCGLPRVAEVVISDILHGDSHSLLEIGL